MIRIKPSHKGLLHKEMDVPEGQPISLKALGKEKAEAEKEGDAAEIKRVTFAQNARHWRKVGR